MHNLYHFLIIIIIVINITCQSITQHFILCLQVVYEICKLLGSHNALKYRQLLDLFSQRV